MRGHDGDEVRPAYGELARWLNEVPADVLDYRRREAELIFRRIGITFAVYGEADATERLIPFDVIPRIMSAAEWRLLEKGLTQRVNALNMFLKDVYGAREILRAGVVCLPPAMKRSCAISTRWPRPMAARAQPSDRPAVCAQGSKTARWKAYSSADRTSSSVNSSPRTTAWVITEQFLL
jgi:uncharacterized circularly permuted ATP-grasp superfamily protein